MLGKTNLFMAVALFTDGEVHDHKCAWKSDTSLECEPLKGGMGGEPITEELAFTSGANTLAFKSTTILKDGGRIAFEATATRR